MVNNWRESDDVIPIEGARGSGERRGEIGLADFDAGVYPACSKHGAMNCVGRAPSLWRCLAEGCNIGCEWKKPLHWPIPVIDHRDNPLNIECAVCHAKPGEHCEGHRVGKSDQDGMHLVRMIDADEANKKKEKN